MQQPGDAATGDVLVVEGEGDTAYLLVQTLEREGHQVRWARTGREAIAEVGRMPPDVVILELRLPDMDGLDVCRALRTSGFRGAVMIVSGRDGELDRVGGLDGGADDFLPKPFGLAELHARVRALVRRTRTRDGVGPPPHGPTLRVDRDEHRVYAGDEEIQLTPKEFDVLALLHANRNVVVTRDRLLTSVWGSSWYGSTKTLDVTVGRLRHKLESAGLVEQVVAVRGVGFRLERTVELE